MNLRRIKLDSCFSIFWPAEYGGDLYRGGPGYIVDFDEPYEREWLKGLEYRFEDVPEGESTKADEITHPVVFRKIAKIREGYSEPQPHKTVADVQEENAASAPETDPEDLPDVRPRKKRAKISAKKKGPAK